MGARQIQEIEQAMDRLATETLQARGDTVIARFTVAGRDDVWADLSFGVIEMSYPFLDSPLDRFRQLQILELPGLALFQQQRGENIFLDYDLSASNTEVATFLDQVFAIVLGCGSEYTVAVEFYLMGL